MVRRLGAREARNNFSDLLGRVGYGGEVVIVERSGKALAAMVPIDLYERLMAEREERFQIIDRIRAHVPDVPEAEIERDVEEAIRRTRDDQGADHS
jgi:prevent-host-death family protein